MLKAFLKYCLILFILFLAGNLKSQYIYDTLLLSELEVISNIDDINSPTKRTTIDSIARKELSLNDIGELLSAFTPVFVKSYGRGSLSTVSFRGTGASHTKVLWEGFSINSPMLGQTDFSLLPGSFFDDVELQYGGGSLTNVSGAIGGSINLTSIQNREDNYLFKIHQSAGSFNTYLTSASLVLSKSKLSSKTKFIRQSSLNNFRYYNNAILPSGEEMTQENANFINTGFTQQLSYKLSDKQEITLITWNQWSDRTIPTIMMNIEKGGNQQEWQKVFFSRNIISWKLHNDNTTWDAKGGYFHENLNYYLRTSDTLDNILSLIDSHNRLESFSFKGSLLTSLKNNLIIKAGINALHQYVNSNNYTDKKQQSVLNSYISLKKNFHNKVTAEALLRSEITNTELIPLMPMLGINYMPFKEQDLHIRINVSRNYNRPSLNDLYWYPGGNIELKPEKSIEGEAGVDYASTIKNNHIIKLSAGTYYSSVNNWIVWLPGDYSDWSSKNIPKVLARGAELSFNIHGRFGIVSYNLFAEYAYTRTTNNSDSALINKTSGIQLIYIPKHTANGYLNIHANGYYASWSLSFTGSRNTSLNKKENDPFTLLPGYIINNFSFGKIFKLNKAAFDIRAKIYNVFDIDYQAVLWRAMPGRNYEISVSCKL